MRSLNSQPSIRVRALLSAISIILATVFVARSTLAQTEAEEEKLEREFTMKGIQARSIISSEGALSRRSRRRVFVSHAKFALLNRCYD